MSATPERYLGDGLYASFDGYHVWLRAPQAFGPDHKVALEPEVWAALVAYVQSLKGEPR